MHKLAAIQMTSSESVEANLSQAGKLIESACQAGAELVVLPEMFPIVSPESETKFKHSELLGQGPIQDFLNSTAKKHGVWLVGGTIPIRETDNKIKAACLVINAMGDVVFRYDKIHLFDVTICDTESYQESATITPGNQLGIVETPFGKLGLAVCYDVRFPELFRCLFNMGAEIIAMPAAFTVKTGLAHWEVLMRARAIENFCYVIGACQTGEHDRGRKTYGHSLIVNPWGEVVASLAEGQGFITADMDVALLKTIRKNLPVGDHQKIFFDLSRLK